jgi:hypothetical protein
MKCGEELTLDYRKYPLSNLISNLNTTKIENCPGYCIASMCLHIN